MSQPLVGMDLTISARPWARISPDIAPASSTKPSTASRRRTWSQITTLPAGMRQDLAGRHAVGLPEIDRRLRIDRRHAPLPAPPGRRQDRRNRAHAGRRARHHLHLQPGGLPGGLQVLHDRAARPGAQPDRRRNRRPGAAGGARKPAPAGRRPPQYRHDGPGRAAAEPGQRRQGHPHPAGPGGLRALSAPHHRLHRRHHSQDRGARPRTRPSQTGHLPERLHRRAAPGDHAAHPQISPRRI